ncbi:MAG: prepilin-type N-terminal cleavage/methylation domain-containing protein [Verrucomicrobiota bacterium]|jgi:type II secretory pathway pseudopilin PulG|nr:prepilin-type N-terminal cleavage/methylation domain-containing protein [Verrucomicrobiota bacterium]
MNSRQYNARMRADNSQAFTLLELMVAVSVMTLVIYTLYALFNQTQMALRKNAAQVDVNEAGRAAMEMIVRELSQMEVSGYPAIIDPRTLLTYSGSKSFHSRITPGNTSLLLAYQSDALTPEGDDDDLQQGFRTNILQDFTFTGRGDSGFFVTSYRVVGATNGIGTLARYQTNGTLRVAVPGQARFNKTEVFNRYFFDTIIYAPSDKFEPIADGVIHLRISPYDRLGRPLGHGSLYYDPLGLNLERRGAAGQALFPVATNLPVDGTLMEDHDGQSQVQFYGALPDYFDLEMAVVEPQVLKQVRALPKAAQANYLGRQIGKVTLFRQRIPIRDMK